MTPPPARPSRPFDLVLHIGSGKTGTSSIQDFLYRNRSALAERGLLYPTSPGRRRHVRVGLFIRPDRELDGTLSWRRMRQPSPVAFRRSFRRRLFTEVDESGLSRVLFSDEALYSSSDEALRRLRTFTDRVTSGVRVVVYLRRQDDHVASRYQQVVKTGEVRRLAERVATTDERPAYDYLARLRTWQEIVAPDELIVRPFERDRFVDGSLLQDFLATLDLDLRVDDLEPGEPRNESLDAESVEALRLLNLYRVEHEGAVPGLIDNRDLVARLTGPATGPTLTLPDDVLDAFMARWEASNRAVAREYLGDPDGRLFHAPRKTRHTTTEQYLDPGRVDHFLDLLELPDHVHAPLRRLAEREARRH